MENKQSKQIIVVASCCAMTTVLGTIHAFSVFVPQWQNTFGANRASVSLVYSLALVSLTIAVLFGYRIYKRYSPAVLFAVCGLIAAAGLALAARSSSLLELTIFYGIVFGSANGVGYGYALQLAGQTSHSGKGFAMGLVTAFYAVGATLAPVMFVALIKRGGNDLALLAMAVIVLLVSFVSAAFVHFSGASFLSESATAMAKPLADKLKRTRLLLWFSYGGAVAAGLMVIGHAFAIALWLNPDGGMSSISPVVVSLGNMLGGFTAGYFSDRLSSRSLLLWLPVLTCVGLLCLVSPLSIFWIAMLTSLGIIGYCYGALIAVYPVAISDIFGTEAAPRIYGQIFTAWGVAGLVGPWFSGWLFDQTMSYKLALIIAAGISLLSLVSIRVAYRDERWRGRTKTHT